MSKKDVRKCSLGKQHRESQQIYSTNLPDYTVVVLGPGAGAFYIRRNAKATNEKMSFSRVWDSFGRKPQPKVH